MGISPDSLVLIQDNLNHDILFLTSTRAVIGWTALQNSIRIYFHQVIFLFFVLCRHVSRVIKCIYRVRPKSWYDFRGCFRGQILEVQKISFISKQRFCYNLLMIIKQFFWEIIFKLRVASDLLKALFHLARQFVFIIKL